ncbi:MAG: hypothetical protein HOQ24_10505 [Mycobacteriaceae bacterium]|nr:hypothetical protein [Mycobacteriaceae bacterium]
MTSDVVRSTEDKLRSLRRLYGAGSPGPADLAAAPQLTVKIPQHLGKWEEGYREARSALHATGDVIADKDGSTDDSAVEAASATIIGRTALTRHLSDFSARAAAVTSVTDARSGHALLLAAADDSLAAAARRVHADLTHGRTLATRLDTLDPTDPQDGDDGGRPGRPEDPWGFLDDEDGDSLCKPEPPDDGDRRGEGECEPGPPGPRGGGGGIPPDGNPKPHPPRPFEDPR